LFQLIKKKKIVITRRDSGSYVDGKAVEGWKTTVEIEGHIQPLKYRETLMLPEASRSNKACKVYSKELLRGLKEGELGWAADRFEWQGDWYEVMKQQEWDVQTSMSDHFCAYAVRIEITPDEEEEYESV
jgi:hypothetical protein